MKPMPPCTCTPTEAASRPTSVDQALAMGVSSSWRALAAARSASVPASRASSASTAVIRQMPRAASILAFVSASISRTSGWSQIRAEVCPVQADRPCRRSSEKAIACCQARSPMATPCTPT